MFVRSSSNFMPPDCPVPSEKMRMFFGIGITRPPLKSCLIIEKGSRAILCSQLYTSSSCLLCLPYLRGFRRRRQLLVKFAVANSRDQRIDQRRKLLQRSYPDPSLPFLELDGPLAGANKEHERPISGHTPPR